MEKKGKKFVTQTDSEVIACLLDDCFDGDVLRTIGIVAKKLKGSFALAILHKQHSDKIYVAKKKSPLVVGFGEAECFVSSDPMAFANFSDKVVFLRDGEMGVACNGKFELFDFCSSFGKAGNYISIICISVIIAQLLEENTMYW